MRPNIYYNVFYILVSFLGSKPADRDFHIRDVAAAAVLLSICVSANFFSLMMLLELMGVVATDYSKWSLFVFLLVLSINYFLLLDANKHRLIIKFYARRYRQRNSRTVRWAVVAYIIFSIALVLFLTDVTRNIW